MFRAIITRKLKMKGKNRRLLNLLREPALLILRWYNTEEWRNRVRRKYGLKDGLPLISPGIFTVETEQDLVGQSIREGGCLPADLALLRTGCRRFEACRYFEIGTWMGESAMSAAKVSVECFTLDISGRIIPDLPSNVTQLTGDSLSFSFAAFGKKADVIFVDGDHRYEFVKNDTIMVFRHLVHDRTVVIWHDYTDGSGNVRYEVMSGILTILD